MKRLILFLLFLAPLTGFNYYRSSFGLFTPVHILIVDPKVEQVALVATEEGKSVLQLAKEYEAKAAINGSFFNEKGKSTVPLKVHSKWLQRKKKTSPALGWSSDGRHALIQNIRIEHGEIQAERFNDEWNSFPYILGGIPLLVEEGVPITSYSSYSESFKYQRHPRTAVGLRENGEWVIVVVDGRFFKWLGGMTLPELATFMVKLGCKSALNLDGGGSSTMVIKNRVVNTPAGVEQEDGKRVRSVFNAILLLPLSSLK